MSTETTPTEAPTPTKPAGKPFDVERARRNGWGWVLGTDRDTATQKLASVPVGAALEHLLETARYTRSRIDQVNEQAQYHVVELTALREKRDTLLRDLGEIEAGIARLSEITTTANPAA